VLADSLELARILIDLGSTQVHADEQGNPIKKE
jgi:hypothetical protein